MAKKEEKFPPTLFVRWVEAGGETYLNTEDTAQGHAEVGETAIVGEYQFVQKLKVDAEIQVKVTR